jgi:hypothetical protein
METATDHRRGVIGGSAAILRQCLRTPRVRKSIEIILGDLDPENAPALIDAVTEDSSLPYNLLSSTPPLVNAGAMATEALFGKVLAAPPKLLRAFVVRVVDGVDAERLGNVVGLVLVLAVRIQRDGEVRARIRRFGDGFRRGLSSTLEGHGEGDNVKESVTDLASALRAAGHNNQSFVENFLRPFMEAAKDALASTQIAQGEQNAG